MCSQEFITVQTTTWFLYLPPDRMTQHEATLGASVHELCEHLYLFTAVFSQLCTFIADCLCHPIQNVGVETI